jgi:MFS transporter, DHA2 family, multidrug resistance protein
VYRGMMANVVPNSVPPEAAEAARGTLGGAIATAQQLPGTVAADLVSAARDAFAEGLEMTAAVGAVVAQAPAVVVAVVLRRARSGSAAEAPS